MENNIEFTPEQNPPTPPYRPWLYISFKPRSTMRQILDYNPRYGVFLLGWLAGAVSYLNISFYQGTIIERSPLRIIVSMIIWGGVSLLLGIYLLGAFQKWATSSLGGQGSVADTRAALAWSSLPYMILGCIYTVIIYFLNKHGYFNPSNWSGWPTGNPFYYLAYLVNYSIRFYGFILFITCIAEAHRISGWRAFAAFLLATFILAIPIIIIALSIDVIR